MSSASKVWFSTFRLHYRSTFTKAKRIPVTGYSSGFGLAVTELALLKGDKVAATLRKPDVLADLATKYPDTLLVLRLDVTRSEEVTKAFSAVRDRFGRIDVVLSNGSWHHLRDRGTSEKNARNLFEVNFWGASYVCKEAVRFFREENQPTGGRLIRVSSMSGVESSPGSAWYCAS